MPSNSMCRRLDLSRHQPCRCSTDLSPAPSLRQSKNNGLSVFEKILQEELLPMLMSFEFAPACLERQPMPAYYTLTLELARGRRS